jgi:tRNA(fMet)-specific endonuclease VapC
VAVLIDTSMLVDLERGVANEAVDNRIGEQDRAISVITVSELLHGVHRSSGARRNRRSAFVEHLLTQLPAIAVTQRIARVHADIWAQLEQRGEPIGAHDLWIAATALAHGMAVATLNAAEFSRVNGLHIIAPAS